MQTLSLNADYKSNRLCQICGLANLSSAYACKRCGSDLNDELTTPRRQPTTNILSTNDAFSQNLPLFLGIFGSILLFIGVFTPLVSLPIVGNINYFQNGKGDGVLILVLACMSLFLVLSKRFKGIYITSFLSVAILAFTFFRFQWFMSNARGEMRKGDNPFKGLGETMLDTIQLQWGWAILIIGVGLLFAAAFVKGRMKEHDHGESVRDNRDLYAGITLACLIVAGWVYLAVIPQFSNGANALFGTKDTTENKNASKEKELSEQLEPLRKSLSVSISAKKFIGSNIYSGRILDELSFAIQQSNNSGKDIRAYKGVFIFKDIFDDEITKISFKSDQILSSGETKKENMSMNYNQFVEAHQKLRSTPIENLHIEWRPESIIFADGTGLDLNGERVFSIPDNGSPEKTADIPSVPTNRTVGRVVKTKITPKYLAEQENSEIDKMEVDKEKEPQKLSDPKTSRPLSVVPNVKAIRLSDGRMKLVDQ